MAQKKKLKKVTKPYLTGAPLDGSITKDVLGVMGMTVAMAILFLLLGSALIFDAKWLSIIMNGALLLTAYAVFYVSGVSRGAIAVNQGEILYTRQEQQRPFTEKEHKACYHPLKGFLTGILGMLPFVLCCAVLACITEKQTYGIGVLPSWVNSITARRTELAAPLAVYSTTAPLSLQEVLRVVARILLMPIVSMLGATNFSNMLLLEHISPLLVLLPAVSYGIGYTRGTSVRTKVHSQIAASNRKKKRSSINKKGELRVNAKEKDKKTRVRKGPEQLN